MKFSHSLSLVSLIPTVLAGPLEKRAVVTDYVHKTVVVYQNQHVWVDGNGQPISTSVELVSTSFNVPNNQPTSIQGQVVSTQEQVQVSTQALYTSQAAPAPTPASSFQSQAAAPVSSQPAYSSHPSDPFEAVSSLAGDAVSSAAAALNNWLGVPSSSHHHSTTMAAVPVSSHHSHHAHSSSAAAAPAASSGSSSGGSGGQFSGQATFFTPGLGACGWTNSDSDFIAALNAPQFGSGSNGNPNCGKSATIHRGGKSVTVKIVDECPECSYGSLDLSPAAFDVIASEDEGRVEITWSWN